MSLGVDSQKDAAVFGIPAGLQMPAYNFGSMADHLFIGPPPRPVHDEPHRFDGMTGHYEGSFIRRQLAIIAGQKLEQKLALRPYKMIHHTQGIFAGSRFDRAVAGRLSQLIRHLVEDHRDAMIPAAGRQRVRGDFMEIRLLDTSANTLKDLDRRLQQRVIRGGATVLADAVDHEAIGIDAVRAFQRLSFASSLRHEAALRVARMSK